MRFKTDILRSYLSMAPAALAMERSVEGSILSRQPFEAPVLDIGCGEGLFARMLFDEPLETGIDPDPRELQRASELGGYVELIRCFGNAIPKPDASFQTILSNSVLEHIPDVEPVLREAHRLLRPGGRFYVTVPSDNFDRFSAVNRVLSALRMNALAARYRRFFNSFWRHYHYYPVEGWAELARRCGFRVLESHAYDPAWLCTLNDLLAPVGAIGFISKKLTNRWTWLPGCRRVCMYPFYLWARRALRGCDHADPGGLVFLSLTKDA